MAKGVECELCGKVFRSRYNLQIHSAVHTGEKPHTCDICGKTFQQKYNLATHFSRIHLGQKPFKCRDCGKSFGYTSHFKAHVKTHFVAQLDVPDHVKDVVLRPHSCEKCQKRFETLRQLEDHSRRHSAGKPYSCDACGKELLTKRGIVQHINNKCFSQGTQNSRLKDPTPCEFCGKTVARYSMTKHINIHTRTRLYQCRFCGKTFLEAAQRVIHERTHNGSKPHTCEICGKGHAQYGNLQAHRKRHHGLTNKPPKNKNTNKQSSEEVNNGSKTKTREPVVYFVEMQPALNTVTPLEQQIALPEQNPDSPAYVTKTESNDILPNTKQCTGGETIKDFLNIAEAWISNRIDESKMAQTEDMEESQPSYTNDQLEQVPSPGISGVETTTDDLVNKGQTDDLGKEGNLKDNSGEASLKQEIWNKIISEIGDNTEVNKVLDKLTKKGKRDNLIPLLRRLGDLIPQNSVVRKGEKGKLVWNCWDCSLAHNSRHLLMRHRLTHAAPHLRPHSCKICRKTFTQAGNLQHHLLVHKQAYRWYCVDCGAGFRHKSHFTTHLLRHSSTIPTPRYQCDACGKSCSSKFHLEEHLRTHTKEKPFLCRTCGAQFAASSSFNRHVRQHEGTKESCSICGKEFSDGSCRRRHEANHSVRVLHCCGCGKKYSQKSSLRRHLPLCSNAHNPIQHTFKCQTCGKGFIDNVRLKRHATSHDPTRYPCPYCNLVLKTKETFNRHKASHQS